MKRAGMYMILDTRDLVDVLEQHAPLIEAWVRSGDDDYGKVVIDALLERSVWAHPTSWRDGYKIIDRNHPSDHRLGLSMIYVQRDGRIRQAIYRSGMRRGWRELDITAKARRALRSKAKTKAARGRPRYAVHFLDAYGNEIPVEGDTLEELSRRLIEEGYEGPSIRVTDENGFLRGWVSATSWRAS